jgi:hypothetical protein
MVGILSHADDLKDWVDARADLKDQQIGREANFVT